MPISAPEDSPARSGSPDSISHPLSFSLMGRRWSEREEDLTLMTMGVVNSDGVIRCLIAIVEEGNKALED